MTKRYRGRLEDIRQELAGEGVEYGVSIGRRAPMHRVHEDCIREIAKAGLKPVIFVGSVNEADSRFFDPVRNPLTTDQQKEQLRLVLGDLYDEKLLILQPDVGDEKAWLDKLQENVTKVTEGKKSILHFRARESDAKADGEQIRALNRYTDGFLEHGFYVWQSFNKNAADDAINATEIRGFDLNKLTPAQRDLISAPDYIIGLARAARESNPDKGLLEKHKIPVTVFDLSLDRLRREAGIGTAAVIAASGSKVTLQTLAAAANQLVKDSRTAQPPFSSAVRPEKTFPIKIASASCNQTGGDWPRNLANICKAIDKAVEDGADILCLEELGLSGYERGDDFYYSDNDKTRELLQTIADYAASQNPNLVISVGHPWYFADKSIADQDERRKNPIFNRQNNNFNVQSFISGGEIQAMSAKRYLFNYERGYEKRHFEEWSDAQADRYKNVFGKGREGTIVIQLPPAEGVPAKTIPFGSPVVQIGSGDRKINATHVICEEYWIGSRFDGSADNKDYGRDNPLAQKAKLYDITLAINPNASPPVANKIDKHYELSKLATRHCDVLVHTDGLGSSGSTFAQFGSRLMAQDGKIISEGVRCSMQDVSYTSQVVNVTPPVNKGHKPHVVIRHRFDDKYTAPVQDGPAPWEKGDQRAFEEELRNESLWLFDYMRKNKIPGFMEAVSGGADSSYNTAKVRVMVELGVAELGVEGFMEALSYLPYKQEVIDTYHETGSKREAIKTIMDNMLTGVYMGTDNSSKETLNAARSLIEGGTRDDGSKFEGIGGKFHYRNVQRLIEIYAEIYAGVNPSSLSDTRDAEIRRELTSILQTRQEDTTPEALAQRVEKFKSTFEEVSYDVLSIAKPENQVPYENIQARLRQVLIMLFSNVENKLAIANPNLDEGRNSYTTWGGDLHGGMISGNAHKDKQRLLDHMRLLHDRGLEGISPIASLYWTLKNRPSAELQPLGKDGKVKQFDEDQLGRTFEQMRTISKFMLYDRPMDQQERKNNPIEVFGKCKDHKAFAGDDIETLHDRIRLSYERWGAQTQAKIHGAAIAATYGENIDHQSSLRTPNISANQRPEQAQLALYCLAEMAKRDGSSFEALTGGHTLEELSSRALIDDEFNSRLAAKMLTVQPVSGRKTKIATLYRALQEEGISGLLKPTEASDFIAKATQWRKKASGLSPR